MEHVIPASRFSPSKAKAQSFWVTVFYTFQEVQMETDGHLLNLQNAH